VERGENNHKGEALRGPAARSAPPPPNPYEPAYMRIVRTVSSRIAHGDYREGDQLPSESQFCTEFDVSPMTLRRAVNMLVDRGLVSTVQGRGTFVRSLDLSEATFKLQHIADRWQDAAADVRLLDATIEPANGAVAQMLEIGAGEKTVFLRRLFLKENGSPFMYHSGHVIFDARKPFVESHLRITSLEGVLKSVGGQSFAGAKLTIDPVAVEEEEGRLLQLSPGTAVFRLQHVFHDFGGSPVSCGSFLFRSDEFHLVTHLGAQG